VIRLAGAAVLAAALGAAAAAQVVSAPHAAETFDAAWTIVRDTHFDPKMNGVDWNAVRDELRPAALAAKTTPELRGVLRRMLERLGQSHFAVIPSTADVAADSTSISGPAHGDLSAHTGMDVRLVGDAMLVTAVDPKGGAAAAGVRTGWKLVEIARVPLAGLLKPIRENAKERLAALEAWRVTTTRLRGAPGTKIEVTFENAENRTVVLSVERRPEQGQAVTVGHLPTMFVRVASERRPTPRGATAGVIGFNVWMAAVDAPFQRAVDEFRAADGIVIDLRGNPGGLAAMLMGISGHFISERKPLGVMKTRDTELRFNVNPRLVDSRGKPVTAYGGPVAILVDGLSGSASECFTGGMQSVGRVRVFGQTTMGQALPAMFRKLPNGDVMIYAFGDFVTSDGTRLEGRGVVPDEQVPLSREDLLAGRDRTLDAALAWIDRAREGRGLQTP
jgi:carboxyl-terminal processing protease